MKYIPTARSLASCQAEAERMIEFAKLHVQAAIDAIRENVELKKASYFETSEEDKLEGIDIWEEDCNVPSYLVTVNKDSILNAYPLDLIK